MEGGDGKNGNSWQGGARERGQHEMSTEKAVRQTACRKDLQKDLLQ